MPYEEGLHVPRLPDGVFAAQWHILTRAAIKWWDDNALRLSASLSYYTLFSLARLLNHGLNGLSALSPH